MSGTWHTYTPEVLKLIVTSSKVKYYLLVVTHFCHVANSWKKGPAQKITIEAIFWNKQQK